MTVVSCLFDCVVDTPRSLSKAIWKSEIWSWLSDKQWTARTSEKGFGNWLRRIPRILSLRMIPAGLIYCAQQSSYRVSAPKLTVKEQVCEQEKEWSPNQTYWSDEKHPHHILSSHITFCRMLLSFIFLPPPFFVIRLNTLLAVFCSQLCNDDQMIKSSRLLYYKNELTHHWAAE